MHVCNDRLPQIIEHEANGREEWLSLGFHLMRDHPFHGAPVLAGLWGARWDLQGRGSALAPEDLKALRDTMATLGRGQRARDQDQQVLAKVLWPVMKSHVIAHTTAFVTQIVPRGNTTFSNAS
ncbi:uncharacterized protein LOC122246531 [Penaeus japonicus]|uniref:uncharacterized protein LOC122246531 n=1 Tax=Penaeus japonicus TaxID=27405 RepID=UPI001C7134B8|nr:uncharacterized protein LOC122246531 [Penaeus japonicus]